jgi:hypothetical protein
VYIHGKVELPITATSAYLDIEGIPGRHFHYLFGLLIISDSAEVYRSFWMDNESDGISVFLRFCEFAASLSATIFHYGSYESKVIKELKQRAEGKYQSRCVVPLCAGAILPARHRGSPASPATVSTQPPQGPPAGAPSAS